MATCSLCGKNINESIEFHSYDTVEGNYHCSDCVCLEDANTTFYNKPETSEEDKEKLIASLDGFTTHYLVAALWSSTDENGIPLDENYSIENISYESLLDAKNECEKFQKENAALLERATHDRHSFPEGDYTDEELNGHDFWLTRCGHGSGFWDRGHDEDVDSGLTEAAEKFGNVDVCVGDSGELYFS